MFIAMWRIEQFTKIYIFFFSIDVRGLCIIPFMRYKRKVMLIAEFLQRAKIFCSVPYLSVRTCVWSIEQFPKRCLIFFFIRLKVTLSAKPFMRKEKRNADCSTHTHWKISFAQYRTYVHSHVYGGLSLSHICIRRARLLLDTKGYTKNTNLCLLRRTLIANRSR